MQSVKENARVNVDETTDKKASDRLGMGEAQWIAQAFLRWFLASVSLVMPHTYILGVSWSCDKQGGHGTAHLIGI